jgi:hypothetical protein
MRKYVLEKYNYLGDTVYITYTVNDNFEVRVQKVLTGGKEQIDIEYLEIMLSEKEQNARE